VHRILTTARLNRLSHVDRATGVPIRRYEHPHPGLLMHVDVKKLGNIPDGGGWRYVGRKQGTDSDLLVEAEDERAVERVSTPPWSDNCLTPCSPR
jgi:hypothetical protein